MGTPIPRADGNNYLITKQFDGSYTVINEDVPDNDGYRVTMGPKCECDCPHWTIRIRWPGEEDKHHSFVKKYGAWNEDFCKDPRGDEWLANRERDRKRRIKRW